MAFDPDEDAKNDDLNALGPESKEGGALDDEAIDRAELAKLSQVAAARPARASTLQPPAAVRRRLWLLPLVIGVGIGVGVSVLVISLPRQAGSASEGARRSSVAAAQAAAESAGPSAAARGMARSPAAVRDPAAPRVEGDLPGDPAGARGHVDRDPTAAHVPTDPLAAVRADGDARGPQALPIPQPLNPPPSAAESGKPPPLASAPPAQKEAPPAAAKPSTAPAAPAKPAAAAPAAGPQPAAAAVKPEPRTQEEKMAAAAVVQSGDTVMDAVLDDAFSGPEQRAKERAAEQRAARALAPQQQELPLSPSRDDVMKTMSLLVPAIRGCAQGKSGLATVAIVVRSDGHVESAAVSGPPFAGTASGGCMEGVVRRAKFPRFKQASFRVQFPFAIQ